MAEHFVDDAAEVSAECEDGLIVSIAFGALFLVVALRLRDSFAMVIDSRHHRRLGAGARAATTMAKVDLWHARLALRTLRRDQREAIAEAVES